jgi:hypothetical protein
MEKLNQVSFSFSAPIVRNLVNHEYNFSQENNVGDLQRPL